MNESTHQQPATWSPPEPQWNTLLFSAYDLAVRRDTFWLVASLEAWQGVPADSHQDEMIQATTLSQRQGILASTWKEPGVKVSQFFTFVTFMSYV